MKTVNKLISTPIWVYIGTLTTSVIILLIICIFSTDSQCSNVCVGIGTGLVSSVVVSLIIDIGNTARDNKKYDIQFRRLCSNLKRECSELPSVVYDSVYGYRGYDDNHERTYEKWVTDLFESSDSSEECVNQIRYVIQQIEEIQNASSELLTVCKSRLDNPNITEQFENNIEKMQSVCTRIIRDFKRKEYDSCKSALLKEMKEKIISTFDSLEEDFTREYNEETYNY